MAGSSAQLQSSLGQGWGSSERPAGEGPASRLPGSRGLGRQCSVPCRLLEQELWSPVGGQPEAALVPCLFDPPTGAAHTWQLASPKAGREGLSLDRCPDSRTDVMFCNVIMETSCHLCPSHAAQKSRVWPTLEGDYMRCAHLVVAIVGATSVCQGIQSPCSVECSPGLTSPQPPPIWKLQSGVLSEEKPGLVVGIFLGTLVPQQGFCFFFPSQDSSW